VDKAREVNIILYLFLTCANVAVGSNRELAIWEEPKQIRIAYLVCIALGEKNERVQTSLLCEQAG
jgi:hypothetical protein